MQKNHYLGYIIDEHGVHVDPTKIQVICEWQAPTSLIELCNFSSLANFYHRFMLNLSHIALPLSQVIKGGTKPMFSWSKSQQKAFKNLKHRLYLALVFTLSTLQQPFEIETYAYNYPISTILTHRRHLVAYHRETLFDIVCRYPTYDKEMYSSEQECQQWKHYIMRKDTIIHTYHNPLKFIYTQGKL
jgi:hypothetical protein